MRMPHRGGGGGGGGPPGGGGGGCADQHAWTGKFPAAVSPDSITQSEPSSTALATSVASARVGRGFLTMDSSICVAVITGLPACITPACAPQSVVHTINNQDLHMYGFCSFEGSQHLGMLICTVFTVQLRQIQLHTLCIVNMPAKSALSIWQRVFRCRSACFHVCLKLHPQ